LASFNEYFGLDIGTGTIRVVQLDGVPNKNRLIAYGSVQVPPTMVMSDSKIDQERLAQIITDLMKNTGIKTRNVVTAIPGTSVFSAVVKLPAMTNTEIEKAIRYQAEQNIPLKIDEVRYDWQVIRQDSQTKELSVMIIAAAVSKVNSIMNLLGYANLNLVALETAPVAMARSLSTSGDNLVMILDVGSTTTEIAIIESGVLMQTRSLPIGGTAMTRAISQGLRLEQDQADVFKMKFGLSQDKLEGQVFKALEPVMRNVADEAIRSSKFFEEQFGSAVPRIILTGGTSRLPLISDYLRSVMGVEVVYGNPWAKVSFQPNMNDQLNQIAPEFATAVGLAMRG
jgi:type IV pilus assembly protein PilM